MIRTGPRDKVSLTGNRSERISKKLNRKILCGGCLNRRAIGASSRFFKLSIYPRERR